MKLAAQDNPVLRRLQSMPSVGPMTAAAINVFAPSVEAFRSGRDFAAWVGLVPRQHSMGGKPVSAVSGRWASKISADYGSSLLSDGLSASQKC